MQARDSGKARAKVSGAPSGAQLSRFAPPSLQKYFPAVQPQPPTILAQLHLANIVAQQPQPGRTTATHAGEGIPLAQTPIGGLPASAVQQPHASANQTGMSILPTMPTALPGTAAHGPEEPGKSSQMQEQLASGSVLPPTIPHEPIAVAGHSLLADAKVTPQVPAPAPTEPLAGTDSPHRDGQAGTAASQEQSGLQPGPQVTGEPHQDAKQAAPIAAPAASVAESTAATAEEPDGAKANPSQSASLQPPAGSPEIVHDMEAAKPTPSSTATHEGDCPINAYYTR